MCTVCIYIYIERQYEDPEFGAHTPTYPHAHAHAHKNWASRSRFEEAVGGVQEVECEEQRVEVRFDVLEGFQKLLCGL